MTEEKKVTEPEARVADRENAAPDMRRRKLTQAALSAPVIMSLGPRAVLGEAVDGNGSVLTSVTGDSLAVAGATEIEAQEASGITETTLDYTPIWNTPSAADNHDNWVKEKIKKQK